MTLDKYSSIVSAAVAGRREKARFLLHTGGFRPRNKRYRAACSALASITTGILAILTASCSRGEQGPEIVQLDLPAERLVSLNQIIPKADRVCILRDWLSFDDYVAGGVAFATKQQADLYRQCPPLTDNNPDGENLFVAIYPKQCPKVFSFNRPVLTSGGPPFLGNCVSSKGTTLRMSQSHIEISPAPVR